MRLVLALPQYHCGWSVEQDNMKDLLLSIIDLLNKIPATFWGVVVGSLFTLSGIYLTNRAGDRRLRCTISKRSGTEKSGTRNGVP